MKIICLGSSSKGNCYVLERDNQILILEAGINPKEVLKAIKFRQKEIVGVFITHEHLDHSKYINEWLQKSVKVFATAGTFDALGIEHHNAIILPAMYVDKNIMIQHFKTFHDVAEPVAFWIKWKGFGEIAFITDTYKLPYKLTGIKLFMVEANYSKELLLDSESVHAKRVITSHLPIDETIKFLKRSVDEKTEKIMLLHLSDGHSNAEQFKNQVQQTLGIPTVIADKNMKIEME